MTLCTHFQYAPDTREGKYVRVIRGEEIVAGNWLPGIMGWCRYIPPMMRGDLYVPPCPYLKDDAHTCPVKDVARALTI